ncbi:MAG TPA: pyruvate, water dikinase regulatory protein [Polyangiaceae bacterium]|nr:pyruvate, water dikinase regulatory protein [Polyangiaceae bacterium]
MLTVHVLSGGSGRTCQHVLRACLAQFPGVRTNLVLRPPVASVRAAQLEVEEAARAGALVCHSLVEPEVRRQFERDAERRGVRYVDVLGPMLSAVEDATGMAALGRPGLSYQLHKEQFDRMDAVDFTLAHDDGQRPHELHQADIVVVGVSRVSKSVTCFYLAYRGVRAANVPLGDGIPPPEELLRLPSTKVVGLTMNPHRLRMLREMRLVSLESEVPNYADESAIQAELRSAQRLMTECGWRSIDVSYKAVEEVAVDLLHLLD